MFDYLRAHVHIQVHTYVYVCMCDGAIRGEQDASHLQSGLIVICDILFGKFLVVLLDFLLPKTLKTFEAVIIQSRRARGRRWRSMDCGAQNLYYHYHITISVSLLRANGIAR